MLVCVSASAVPAKRGVKRTVTLGDGTKVELTLRGDEHYKFYTSSDGFAYREKAGSNVFLWPKFVTSGRGALPAPMLPAEVADAPWTCQIPIPERKRDWLY